MKYVYLLKRGQLDFKKEEFFFYDEEVYSSFDKVSNAVHNGIECNSGTDVEFEDSLTGSNKDFLVTYNCMSAPCDDGERKPMRIRYHVKKIEVR